MSTNPTLPGDMTEEERRAYKHAQKFVSNHATTDAQVLARYIARQQHERKQLADRLHKRGVALNEAEQQLLLVRRILDDARHPKRRGPQILCEIEAALNEKPTERRQAQVREFAEELRKWWSFDNHQQHTHSWHCREDFIEQMLPKLLRGETDA